MDGMDCRKFFSLHACMEEGLIDGVFWRGWGVSVYVLVSGPVARFFGGGGGMEFEVKLEKSVARVPENVYFFFERLMMMDFLEIVRSQRETGTCSTGSAPSTLSTWKHFLNI